MKQHRHAELIKAWADGADIQVFVYGHTYDWIDCKRPTWNEKHLFRLKPMEPVKHEWVGLDEHDFDVLFLNEDGIRFAKYIEAKLKEKNDRQD